MVRLILSVLLFLVSLLVIFGAPEYHIWMLAVAVNSYPLVFTGITFILLLSLISLRRYRLPAVLTAVIAFALFLYPVVNAWSVARSLPNAFNSAVNSTEAKAISYKPFSFLQLLKGPPAMPFKTITYDSASHLTFDYYRNSKQQKQPCVVVVHGGSWSGGNSRQLPGLNGYLSVRGYNVASINYHLAPKYRNPVPVEDVRHLINYLKANAIQLNIDTGRFVLLGRSAGAQIALLAAYAHPDKNIKGVIDFYGPADMVWGYSVPANPLIMNSRKVMQNYIGDAYEKMPDKYAASSPVLFVNERTVPTLIIHGDNDVLVSPLHSTKLDSVLSKNKVPHLLVQLPWATHGFDYNLNGPGGQLSTYLTLRFLQVVCR
ncbi:alpha/beta hydrolase [Mucilaginibacter terrenus]|uniref:Alpha/beta hydrolase n=1 Tax=Mucilaginibacter terrenus TaxID=2482727 RepID=A0A3E2NPI8_9SPHI|nr:alpha/beta hydrolase [Mucilaginibacter terrenus]RFZ82925.1 alpha/beta hydrolase [Mucilaginibacter terrenus]